MNVLKLEIELQEKHEALLTLEKSIEQAFEVYKADKTPANSRKICELLTQHDLLTEQIRILIEWISDVKGCRNEQSQRNASHAPVNESRSAV